MIVVFSDEDPITVHRSGGSEYSISIYIVQNGEESETMTLLRSKAITETENCGCAEQNHEPEEQSPALLIDRIF